MAVETAAAIIRQVIAETLLVFDVALLVFIARHVYCEVKRLGLAAARVPLGNKAALAVGVHITGLTIIRAWTTAQFYLQARHIDPDAIESLYGIPLFGLLLAVVGMACCIRIFSPAKWGNWGWVLAFMAAIGFVGWMQAR